MKAVCNSVGLSYFGHITRRKDSLEKTLMLGKKKAVGKEEEQVGGLTAQKKP